MSSLADLPELVGFFSYSRNDDRNSQGALSKLRTRIQMELHLQLGRDFRLWQDTAAIPSGALWESELKKAIAESAFFIPIVTPSAVASPHCRFEFQSFLEREEALGRADLIFPILYIRVSALEKEELWRRDDLLKIVGARQYVNWQPYRHRDVASPDVAEKIEQFCANILDALHKHWISPEERRRAEEAEAAQRAEEQQRRLEAEAIRRAEEEEQHRKAAAEAQRRQAGRAEEERRRVEAEAMERAEKDEQQRKAAAKAAERATALAEEKRRRQESEAELRAQEKERQRTASSEAPNADGAAAQPEERHKTVETAGQAELKFSGTAVIKNISERKTQILIILVVVAAIGSIWWILNSIHGRPADVSLSAPTPVSTSAPSPVNPSAPAPTGLPSCPTTSSFIKCPTPAGPPARAPASPSAPAPTGVPGCPKTSSFVKCP